MVCLNVGQPARATHVDVVNGSWTGPDGMGMAEVRIFRSSHEAVAPWATQAAFDGTGVEVQAPPVVVCRIGCGRHNQQIGGTTTQRGADDEAGLP